MKLFRALAFSAFVVGAYAGGRNENGNEIESEQQKGWKKECKSRINNKEDSNKFKEKLQKCMNKKQQKFDKNKEREQKRAERVIMKQNVNDLKEEKAAIKAERGLCKARCSELANQVTKQNCNVYWKTITREKIEEILDDIMDQKNPSAREAGDHCLTDAGLTGNEVTCKQHAVNYCDALDLDKPSPNIRQCKSSCINSCMEGVSCDWTL